MKKGIVVWVGFFIIGSFVFTHFYDTIFHNQENNQSQETLKTKHLQTMSQKIFENTNEDKEYLLNLMINSTYYFNTLSGNMTYSSINNKTDLDIDFSVGNGETHYIFRNKDNIKSTSDVQQLVTTTIKNYGIKNDKTLMDITQVALLPQDFAANYIGRDFTTWNIVDNEKYLCRNSVVVEARLNKDNAAKTFIRIDTSTGIILEASLIDHQNKTIFMAKMNNMSIDSPLNTQLFDKYKSVNS